MSSISLFELGKRIEETIKNNFNQAVWVRAEISDLNEKSGHCYLELVEKSEHSNEITAKFRASCWASTYQSLKPYFETTTGQRLAPGLKVLIAVVVNYHPIYGLSLTIRDINPVFTIGEMAIRRQETIRQLEADGVLEMNKSLKIPIAAQRIAIISSESAAGYDDFCNQLSNNRFGYVFYHKLFPATMQGNSTEQSVIAALERIFDCAENFDLVVIIRGGGATTDLVAFDSYLMASNCAQFPLPIIAGIGHQRDISVVDIVANTSVKTPTAAAELLIDNLQKAENKAKGIVNEIYFFIKNEKEQEEHHLLDIRRNIQHSLKNQLLRQQMQIKTAVHLLKNHTLSQINRHTIRLKMIEKSIETHSPSFLIERGYSITTLNGKRLVSSKGVKKGDEIKTFFSDGTLLSKVEQTEK